MNRSVLAGIAFVASAGAAVLLFHGSHPAPRRSVPVRTAAPRPTRTVHDPRAELAALSWAERQLAAIPDRMPRSSDSEYFPGDARDAEASFEAIAAKYGPSSHSYLGIGRCALRLGHYGLAVRAFAAAVRLSPSDPSLAAALHQAQDLEATAESLDALLPRGQVIIQLRPYPLPAPRKSWVALCGTEAAPADDMIPGRFTGRLTLRLFVKRGGRYNCVWSAADTIMQGDSPGDGAIYVENLSGGRVPQLVFHEFFVGGSTEPTHLTIYAWDRGSLRRVLNLDATSPFRVQDVKHNGTYQVWMSREIGFTMCHAAQPRWTDVYSWQRGQFRLADRNYPGAFRHWLQELRGALRQYPHDADILAYLAAAEELLGRHQAARRDYHNAERSSSFDTAEPISAVDLAKAYAIGGRKRKAEQLYHVALWDCDWARREKTDAGDYEAACAPEIRAELSALRS